MDQTAANWQKEIYLNGFAGIRPAVPVDLTLLASEAKRRMSAKAYAYIAGGAGWESTMNGNREAFDKFKIVPRMLCNVGERDTTMSLFGQRLPSPFLISPVGVLEMVHRDADLAVARAAKKLRIPYIFSNQASYSMEDCSSEMETSPRWFQLYWSRSNALVESFVHRAQRCGCTAIVVTLDTTLLGWRTRDLDIAYLPFLEGKGIAQYTSDPIFQKMMDEPETLPDIHRRITLSSIVGLIKMVNRYPGSGFVKKLRSGRPLKAVRKFVSTYSNPCTTWEDLKLLRQYTSLPIILKGILHPEDARKALDVGMDGIIISNHGGRQVDGAIATFEALPNIVKIIDGKIPVLLDSGIRGGADAFKAIALGANAVCIGRPYVYGLTIAGAHGVYEVLRNIMADFELTMGLAGCRNIREIAENTLVRS
jgi:lactate 2-monooxygenase